MAKGLVRYPQRGGRQSSRIAVPAILFSLALSAGAQGRAPLRLQSLVDESQLIVIGTLTPPAPSALDEGVGITPLRALKGSLPASSMITLEVPTADSSCPGGYPPQPMAAIWFLNPGEGGSYVPVRDSLDQPCVYESTLFEMQADTAQALPDSNRGQSAIDNVAQAIAAEATQTSGDSPLALIHDELFLADASQPVQESIYLAWQQATSPRLRMLGLVGRVALGDSDAILSLAYGPQDYRRTDLPHRFLQNGSYLNLHGVILGFPTYEGAVAEALGRINAADAAAVQALGVVARRPDLSLEIRRNAAKALRLTDTQQSARELATILNFDDLEMSAEAVAGLSDYAMGRMGANQGANGAAKASGGSAGIQDLAQHAVAGPAAVTAENRAQYVQYWSEWSRSHLPN